MQHFSITVDNKKLCNNLKCVNIIGIIILVSSDTILQYFLDFKRQQE